MFFLQDDIRIIDTPGIKGFGMIDIQKEELFHFFPELFRRSNECRFNNCLHMNEPGCAVLEAVKNGSISFSRYSSYYSIMQDLDDKYRK
jgi:ribosome biogenesis GTPase